MTGIWRGVLAVCVVAWMCAACNTAPHPESVIRDHIDAVRSGDADAIYEMLGPQQRQDMTLEEFRVFFHENHDDIMAEAAILERALDKGRLEVVAGIPVENQGELALRHQNDTWWIDDDPLRLKPLPSTAPPKDEGEDEDDESDAE